VSGAAPSAWDLLRRLQTQQTAKVSAVLPRSPNAGRSLVSEGERASDPVSGLEALRRLQGMAVPEGEVQQSEAKRIRGLPTWDAAKFKVDLTEKFKSPDGTMTLNLVQSLSLHWAPIVGGLLAPLAVGAGKGLLTLLLGTAMGARRPLLLIPPAMQIPLRREIEKFRPHWKLPLEKTSTSEPLKIMPYSMLSTASSTRILEELRPDLIIADEAHMIGSADSARTKRILRYYQSFPETRFCGMSGTFTSKGLKDYAHLAELALRDNSPLPLLSRDLIAWANCVDSDAETRARPQDWSAFYEFAPELREIEEDKERRAMARSVFLSRFRATPGVVATEEGSVACSLYLRKREAPVPAEVWQAIIDLRRTWTRPDGEELVTAIDYWRCAQQLVQGFYYRWVWPDGIVDYMWLQRRAEWHRNVRQALQRSLAGFDSPLLVTRAVLDGRLDDFHLGHFAKTLAAAWKEWDEVRHRPRPPTETVWISDYIVHDALVWRSEHPNGIVWINDKAIEDRLRQVRALCVNTGSTDLPEIYGAGEVPPDDGRGMMLSIRAHGTGLNLQKHSESLILSFPSSGKTCEQLLGRLHRYGQTADEVTFDYYASTEEGLKTIASATRDAKYIQQTQGGAQKLLYAAWI
jgi:hypothetical protein